MKSIDSLTTPTILKSLTYVLISISVILFLSLFLPWRQTVSGEGQVTVFSPMQRPQTIHSQIDAKISKWYVNEGDIVKEGTLLLELDELNPQYLDTNQLDNLMGQRFALLNQRTATQRLISSLSQQTESFITMKGIAMPSANLQIEQQSDRLTASEQKYNASQQNFKTAELNYERRKQLFEKGLNSKRDLELAELVYVQAQSDLRASQADLDIARRSVSMSRLDSNKVSAETSLKVQEAEARSAQAFEKLANIDSSLYKIDIELANLQSRIQQRTIYAPTSGQVTRLATSGYSETIKAGAELATIVPETSDQAVEIYVPDYFAPLVSVGRQVRLQFSGWPGFQFGGWPSVSLGTFAGKVAVIDAVADDKNQYRILIKPDHKRIEETIDEKWPEPNILRPGTKAVAWIILDEVPVWYELWRIINGFPPTIMENPSKTRTRAVKKK